MMRRRPIGRERRGFALVTALWLLVAIATIGLQFSIETRDRRLSATNLVEETQARAAALAGVETTRSRLSRFLRDSAAGQSSQTSGAGSQLDDPWAAADTMLSGASVIGQQSHEDAFSVVVRDGGSVLDVNALSEDDWRNFFLGLQVDYDQADRLAQAIMDWRDQDDDPRTSGAERDQYIAAGRLVLPSNRDLQTVEELKSVLGMTDEIFDQIEPYLTVAKVTRVNVHTAPVPVLRSLPGFTDQIVESIVALRAQGVRFRNLQDMMAQVGGAGTLQSQVQTLNQRLTFTTRELEISSTGFATGHRTHVEMRALVAKNRLSATLRWQRIM